MGCLFFGIFEQWHHGIVFLMKIRSLHHGGHWLNKVRPGSGRGLSSGASCLFWLSWARHGRTPGFRWRPCRFFCAIVCTKWSRLCVFCPSKDTGRLCFFPVYVQCQQSMILRDQDAVCCNLEAVQLHLFHRQSKQVESNIFHPSSPLFSWAVRLVLDWHRDHQHDDQYQYPYKCNNYHDHDHDHHHHHHHHHHRDHNKDASNNDAIQYQYIVAFIITMMMIVPTMSITVFCNAFLSDMCAIPKAARWASGRFHRDRHRRRYLGYTERGLDPRGNIWRNAAKFGKWKSSINEGLNANILDEWRFLMRKNI